MAFTAASLSACGSPSKQEARDVCQHSIVKGLHLDHSYSIAIESVTNADGGEGDPAWKVLGELATPNRHPEHDRFTCYVDKSGDLYDLEFDGRGPCVELGAPDRCYSISNRPME